MDKIIICTENVNVEEILSTRRRRSTDLPPVTELCRSDRDLVASLEHSARQGNLSEAFFTVKTVGGPQLCPLSNIMFCRSDGHRFQLCRGDGTMLLSSNTRCCFLKSVGCLLEDPRFLCCGRALVINRNFIQAVDGNEVILYGGVRLPLPIQRQKELRDQLRTLE